jgi:DNA-binding PadR family transcriptional regulator
MLHDMAEKGLLVMEERNIEGKIRKYYTTTPLGDSVLEEAQAKAYELFKEIKE